MDFKRKIDTLQNQQKDNNTILKKIESFLMGNITKKDNQTQTNISLYDSDKTFITDGTSSEKQGVKHLDCEANCPDLDEDKAIKRLSTELDLELKIESVEKHCLLLRLSSIPELFESKEMLYSAIMSLVQKISDAGDIDKSVDSNMDIKITFTSPLTDDERTTIMSMLGTFGTINEGYTAATTDREEGICDIDSTVMDYSDNSGNNERKKVLTKEEIKNLLEKPFYTRKQDDMKSMPMDFQDTCLKVEVNATKSLDCLESGKIKMEAAERKYEFNTKLENTFYTMKKDDIKNMPMDFQDNCLKTEVNATKSLDFLQSRNIKMEAATREYEEMFVRIGNMKCLWRIKGLSNRLQHLDDNQDNSVEEGKQVWYLQWRLECPKSWDISSVVDILNIKKGLIRGYCDIDFVHSEMQREIVVETNTKKNVFKSYSSAELVFKTFIGTIIKVCDLETTDLFDMSVTTLVVAAIEQSDDVTMEKVPIEDNDIVCIHCKNVTTCYKCTEKLKRTMELTGLLKSKDALIENLLYTVNMVKPSDRQGEKNRRKRSRLQSWFLCKVCFQGFTTPSLFQNHMQTAHPVERS